MGIVQRQGIKRSILTYIGVALGLVSTLFVYPLNISLYGLSQFLYSSAEFLVPFMTLGLTSGVVIRFFPFFQDDESKNHGFLALLVWGTLASMLLFTGLGWMFQTLVFHSFEKLGLDTTLFAENAGFILALSAFTIFGGLFENYTSNFLRVVVPSIFNNLVPKIGLPLLILLSYWGILGETTFKFGILAIGAVSVSGLILYMKHLGQWTLRLDIAFLKQAPLWEMASFALYTILSGVGLLLAFRIGNLMVVSLLDTTQGGIFSIGNFISSAIEAPYLAIAAITAPIFAQAINRQSWSEVEALYQKSSLTLLITGLYLFMGIFVCLDDLFRLTPNYAQLRQGEQVVWYLGLAKVIGMAIGLNGNIIGLSRYYRFTLFSILGMAVFNVALNIVLIPKFGVRGAALSTLLAIGAYNLLNTLFTWFIFKIHPFTREAGLVLLFSLPVFTLHWLLPDFGHPLIHILVKGSVVTLLFLGPILWFRLAPDLNTVVSGIWQQIRQRIFKSD